MRTLIVTVAITFLINFVLQIIIDIAIDKDHGKITVSDPVKIDSTSYVQTILISNYQSKTINGLEFYSNKGIIDSVYKEDKIKIIKNDKSKFQISKLYPQINTTLTVFLKSGTDENYPTIIPLNNKEFNFLFGKSSSFEEEIIDWITILINCIIISIMYSLFSHFVDKNNEKRLKRVTDKTNGTISRLEEENKVLEGKTKELNQKIRSTESNIDTVSEKIQEKTLEFKRLSNSWVKIRILLIRQVRDLKKENEFYKSLLSNVVEKSNGKIEMNRLEELIKDVLQTHSTNINVEKDAKLIDAIANILSEKKSE